MASFTEPGQSEDGRGGAVLGAVLAKGTCRIVADNVVLLVSVVSSVLGFPSDGPPFLPASFSFRSLSPRTNSLQLPELVRKIFRILGRLGSSLVGLGFRTL